MIHGNPFDRLGRDARERAEAIADRHRCTGGTSRGAMERAEAIADRHRCTGGTSRGAMRRELVSIGMTREEAERHVELVISTTM